MARALRAWTIKGRKKLGPYFAVRTSHSANKRYVFPNTKATALEATYKSARNDKFKAWAACVYTAINFKESCQQVYETVIFLLRSRDPSGPPY